MEDANEWLTYAQAGERLGITAEAVRAKAIRQRWRRMPGNDGKALVQLPAGLAGDVTSMPPHTRSPRIRTPVERPDIRALTDALAVAREAEQRLTAELQTERARTAVHQADALEQRSRAEQAERERETARVQAARAEGEGAALREALARDSRRLEQAEAARQTAEAQREAAQAARDATAAELAHQRAGGPLVRAWRGFWRS